VAVDDAARVLRRGIDARVFPTAVAEVGDSAAPRWQLAIGRLTWDADAEPATVDTPFDLASLTKPIATAALALQLALDRRLPLDEPVASFFAEWRGADREHVTVRDLLEHASGLPARLVDPPSASRREFEHDICSIKLEYEPRARSIYSDLGFILLGFLIADLADATLKEQFRRLAAAAGAPEALEYVLPLNARFRAAPTMPMEDDVRRGRVLTGEVHDNYAAALGGIAGHAGLFGTGPAVGAYARTWLRAANGARDLAAPFEPRLVAEFLTRSRVPGSSRALGWDTMLTTSSCGTRMSERAFGHVGFTGTSLWIDPGRDRYFVLLTNRAFGAATLDEMREVRRAFHDALGDV